LIWQLNPSGTFAYIVDSAGVEQYAINQSSGELVFQNTFLSSLAGSASNIAIYPDGRFAYVVTVDSLAQGGVLALGVDQQTGALAPISTVIATEGFRPDSIVIEPSGHFVYVANFGAANGTSIGSLSAYSIDLVTGLLQAVQGSPFPTGLAPSSVTATVRLK
jgi:6-phosphogluconolactonase